MAQVDAIRFISNLKKLFAPSILDGQEFTAYIDEQNNELTIQCENVIHASAGNSTNINSEEIKTLSADLTAISRKLSNLQTQANSLENLCNILPAFQTQIETLSGENEGLPTFEWSSLYEEIEKLASDLSVISDRFEVIEATYDAIYQDVYSLIYNYSRNSSDNSSLDFEAIEEVYSLRHEFDALSSTVEELSSDNRVLVIPESESNSQLFYGASGAGFHNSICIEESLGSVFSVAHSNVIVDGSFDNLFVGKYWPMTVNYVWTNSNEVEISDTWTGNMRVAACNPYLKSGLGNHIAVVPDTPFFNAQWHNEETTEIGYLNSNIRTEAMKRARALVIAAFGAEHLITYKDILVSETDTYGTPTKTTLANCDVELMDEMQLLGARIFSKGDADNSIWSIACKQFPLFIFRPDLISNNYNFWERNTSNGTEAANIAADGSCGRCLVTKNTRGLRPFFLIH